jgi:hypothetical protein
LALASPPNSTTGDVEFKVADSLYTSGRGNDWVKKTCAQRETLTIAGFALDGNKWDGHVGPRPANVFLPTMQESSAPHHRAL